MKNIFDVVVIGSGYGGMLPAYKLVKSGYKVLLIERGKHWNPKEFKHELSLEYLNNLYDISSSKSLNELYRGSKILGGGSVTNDKIHQRCPSESFEYIDESINKKAWPQGLNRKVLDPYYSELEELLSIKQLAWDEVSRIGGNFARMFDDAGMSCEPCSFNTGPGCVHCGFCEAGCRYEGEAKLTLTSEVLPKAMATGYLTIKTEMTAKSVKPLIGGEYRVSLIKSENKNMNSKTSEDVFGKKVIIAAGPIGTVPLLHRSARHLPKMSPALGKWASNNGDVNFVLKIPEHYPDHIGYKSSTSCGVITYGYWDKYKKTIHPGMIPIQVAAGVDLRRENGLPWGLDHKHFLKKNVVNRLIPANGMGLVPSDMKIGIDIFGLPTISNPVSKGQEDHIYEMYKLLKNTMLEIGGELLLTGRKYPFDLGGNHILGGARMSDDPIYGVSNPAGEIYNYPGLFVSDASSIPGGLAINPAHTIGANALRIADLLIKNDGGRVEK